MKLWLKILLSLFAIGVIAAALIYVFVYNKPHPDFEKMKPDFTVSAADIYKAFKTNKAGAEKKFNGKVIEITFKLSKIESSDSVVTAVCVFNEGMFGDEGLRCSLLKKYYEDAKKIPAGKEIKIKGYCTGYNDTDVILEQCCIVK